MSRGIVAILFGIAAVFWPGLTTEVLLYLFAGFLVADGLLALIISLARIKRRANKAIILLIVSVIDLAIGLFLFRNPDIAFATFVLILGLSLVITGIFSFVHAFVSHAELATLRTLHALLGVLGIVIGTAVLLQPVAGGLAFVWIVGLYALVAGPVMIAMSYDTGKGK